MKNVKLQIIRRPIVKDEVLKEFPQGSNLDEVIEELKKFQAEHGKEIIINMKEF